MDDAELVASYLAALEQADLVGVLKLFTPDAVVHSPLYGPMPAAQFYPALFADTGESRLTLKGTMAGRSDGDGRLLAFWFHFDWRLPSGRQAPFDVVDLAELSDDGRISSLRIIYDTVDVRPAFEAETGDSWRPPFPTPPLG
jgi:ketosteroid isomerase-like protein